MNITMFCSIYDTAVQAYMRPFMVQAEGQAMREFGDLVCDDNHPVGKHASDYELYVLAEFNDKSGEFTPVERRCLARGHELRAALMPKKSDQDELFHSGEK